MQVEIRANGADSVIQDAGVVTMYLDGVTVYVSPAGVEVQSDGDEDGPPVWFDLTELRALAAGRARLVY